MVLVGKACHKQAMAPHIIGLAKDDPFEEPTKQFPPINEVPFPSAHPSGFICPEKLGPYPLLAQMPEPSTEPTLKALSASAGVNI